MRHQRAVCERANRRRAHERASERAVTAGGRRERERLALFGYFSPFGSESARIDTRSCAYVLAFWWESSAAPTPWIAVPRRDVLMNVNMWLSPLFAVPGRHTRSEAACASYGETPCALARRRRIRTAAKDFRPRRFGFNGPQRRLKG